MKPSEAISVFVAGLLDDFHPCMEGNQSYPPPPAPRTTQPLWFSGIGRDIRDDGFDILVWF
jgi:hypothetical protein